MFVLVIYNPIQGNRLLEATRIFKVKSQWRFSESFNLQLSV